MTTRFRKTLASVALIASWCCLGGVAFAQTVTATNGQVALYISDLSGFTLTGPGTSIGSDISTEGPSQLTVGQTADLSQTIDFADRNSPQSVSVNGQSYTNVFVKGHLTFTAQPFVVPAPSSSTSAFGRLAAPFTLSGTFEGYSDNGFQTLVLSTAVQGVGIAEFPWTHFSPDTNTYFSLGGSVGVLFTLTGPEPAGWSGTDIGNVGLSGNDGFVTTGPTQSQSNVFEVGGAGGDIWGAADAFRFVSQPASGDVSIVANVRNEQNTSSFAKAGVMLRQALTPTSPDVVLDVKPDHSVEFMSRSTDGGETTYLGGTGPITSSTVWLKLTRAGNQVTGSVSTDGSSWTVVGTTTFAAGGYAGLAVTSHDVTALNQAAFGGVTITTGGTGGTASLPAPWQLADVGDVGQPGTASGGNAQLTVSGAGADIWGAADSFAFVYQPFNGDGHIQASVDSVQNTSPFAKAGVMFRGSANPNDVTVVLDVKPDGGVEFMARTSVGGSMQYIGGTTATFPVGLTLERAGSQVTATVGTWTQTFTVPLPGNALVGLAVTSHDTSTLNTSMFERITVAQDLLVNGGFEASTPPSPAPGWISDTPHRQVDAVSDTTNPHSGQTEGKCSSTTAQDCGLYQDVTLADGGDRNYVLFVWAASDKPNAYVGIDVNGQTVGAVPIDANGLGNYTNYGVGFLANPGDRVRVWMYSPASAGTVVIDDVTLELYDGPR